MLTQTGDYTRHTANDTLRTSFYTFTPRPLMTGSFYEMSNELIAILTETHRALGFLEGISFSAKSCVCDASTSLEG